MRISDWSSDVCSSDPPSPLPVPRSPRASRLGRSARPSPPFRPRTAPCAPPAGRGALDSNPSCEQPQDIETGDGLPFCPPLTPLLSASTRLSAPNYVVSGKSVSGNIYLCGVLLTKKNKLT